MPPVGLRRREGTAAPAATALSPVARAYPSRAISGVFQAAAHSTVLSRNESRQWVAEGKTEELVLPNFCTGAAR